MIWAAKQFQWPPSVTRGQSLRDLQLLNDSFDLGGD